MKVTLEQQKLADELNKLYAYVKAGGDFSFASENDEIKKAKDFIMQNYGNLQTGILGFLTDIVNKHPDFEFVFVPSENGVCMNYVYKVVDQVEFDKNGLIVKQTNKTQGTNVEEMTNN